MLYSFQIAVLLDLPGIGKKSVEKVIQRLGQKITNSDELYDTLDLIGKRDAILKVDFDEAVEKNEKLFDNFDINQIKVISRYDGNFPKMLKAIDNPPLLLYVKGSLECLTEQATVAVVGTRDPSKYGYQIGERVGELLAENNITIVSGLAIGCDTAAHKGCLRAKGRTAAVLAHGLHTIYPTSNRNLAHDIIEMGGCLVSEYAFGQNALKHFFVERDRLQSGLSLATIIIETDIKGGTMHTAKFTQTQQRMLYAIQHTNEKKNLKSKGNEYLINTNRAKLLATQYDFDHLLSEINSSYSEFNDKETVLENISVPSKSLSNETNILKLNIEELAERFKIKRISTIKNHVDNGSFSNWSVQKDPLKLKWTFDTDCNQFVANREDDLFTK